MSVQVQMATYIKSYQDIDNLTDINGVPIDMIERRARPVSVGNLDGISQSGFLGKDESFKAVLKADWDTVFNLGLTHVDLKNNLETIWNYTRAQPQEEATILYNPTTKEMRVVNSKLPITAAVYTVIVVAMTVFVTAYAIVGLLPIAAAVTYLWIKNLQLLEASISTFRGKQEDLFDPDLTQEKGWHRDISLTNLWNRESLLVASGVIDYIGLYGFYEGGGLENPYRVDPARLVSVLTGNSYNAVRQRASVVRTGVR